MNNFQKIETANRLLHYDLFDYNISIENIMKGEEYEYAVAVLDHIRIWKYGKWKTPWGIQKSEFFKQMKKKSKIRKRKFIETKTLKEYYLQKGPLIFNFPDDLEVIVFLRNYALTPLVYVNRISEEALRQKPNTELFGKWFSKDVFNNDVLSDYRYLLDLDAPRTSNATNVLYKYLKGMYTGSIELLDKKTKEFLEKETIPNSLEYEKKHNHLIYNVFDKQLKQKARREQALKKVRPRWSSKKKSKEVSEKVQKEKKEKIKQVVSDIQEEYKKCEKNILPEVTYIDGVRHVLKRTYTKKKITVPKKREFIWVWGITKKGKEKKVHTEGPTTQEIEILIVDKHYEPEEYKGVLKYVTKTEYVEVGKTSTKKYVQKTKEKAGYWVTSFHTGIIKRNQNKHVLDELPLLEGKILPKGKEDIPENWEDTVSPRIKQPSVEEKQLKAVKKLVPVYINKSKPYKDVVIDENGKKTSAFAIRKKEENEKKLEKLVCVCNIKTEEVDRIPKSEAKKLVDQGTHVYTSKSLYKKKILEKQKGEKPGLSNFTGITRKVRRQFAKSYRVQKTMFDVTQKVPVKTKKQNIDSHGYLLDEKGNRIVKTNTLARAASEVEHELVPVNKNVWKIKIDETGKKIKELVDVIPKMTLQLQKDGSTKLDYVYKRVLKKVHKSLPLTVTKPVKATYKTITTSRYPNTTVNNMTDSYREKLKKRSINLKKEKESRNRK